MGTISCASCSAWIFLVRYLGILDNHGTVSCGHPGTLGISWAALNFEAQYLVDLRYLGLSLYVPCYILCITSILGYPYSSSTISWVCLGSPGLSCSIMVFKVLYLARRPFDLGCRGISWVILIIQTRYLVLLRSSWLITTIYWVIKTVLAQYPVFTQYLGLLGLP